MKFFVMFGLQIATKSYGIESNVMFGLQIATKCYGIESNVMFGLWGLRLKIM